MIIAGVDEAGRGPVIGPMVFCAFAIDEELSNTLKDRGVKDSKILSFEQRENLYDWLVSFKKFKSFALSAFEITIMMRSKIGLNDIEAKIVSNLLLELSKDVAISKAIIDSPDPIASKYEKRIRRFNNLEFNLQCENKADFNYPVVSAASIIAKVERDRLIEEIKTDLSKKGIDFDFGSGYPHDPKTIEFLEKYHQNENVQIYLRQEWATVKRFKTKQFKLDNF